MGDKEFLDNYDKALEQIEDIIDEQGEDLDYENQAGMLTIFCPDGSQVIVSRQTPSRELWLAAKSGGFHFRKQHNGWQSTRDDVDLKQRLQMVIFEQAQEQLDFDL